MSCAWLPRTVLRSRLAHPWCWPPGGVSGFDRPEPPAVGETVGVTLSPRVLWRLTPRGGGRGTPLVGAAADAAWRAPRLVLSAVPWVGRVEHLRHPRPVGVVHVAAEGPLPGAIDGGSMGLALCLAHASMIVDEAVPTEVIALAGVALDGRLEPVDGLDEKLDWVRRTAPAVGRILVAEGQLGADGSGVERVGTLREALTAVWPDLDARLADRLADDPALQAEVARELRRLVLASGAPLVSWEAVACTARRLGEVARDQAVRRDAELAYRVASRHEGRPAPLDLPRDAHAWVRQRGTRLRLLAQWVQSHADGPDDRAAMQAAEQARAEVAEDRQRTAGDAMLLGAIGRALASAGELERALDVLEEATGLWFDLYREPDATYALSELIRVAGVLGRRDVVARGAGWAERVASRAETGRVSMAFVHLALIRAWVQLGEAERALERCAAGEADAPDLPVHLRDSRRRWRARALDAASRPVQADAVRDRVMSAPFTHLAGLDRALRDGADPGPLLDLLRCDMEAARLLARRPEARDPASWLAERYRY